jgi:putative transposase
MKLPHSTYYYKSKNKPDDEQSLIDRIEAIIEEFPGYGYRRVTRELHRRGVMVNHKKVLRIMKQQGLTCKPKRRWVRTTDSNHPHRVYPNLVQNLLVTGPNQVWVADITYIGIQCGFVCLALILDLFARRAVGQALSRNIDTALCLEALRMALAQRNPPTGIIHHSDRGVQYASHDYVDTLLHHGFRISMSRKGKPYDNATAGNTGRRTMSKIGFPTLSKKFTIASGFIPLSDIGRLWSSRNCSTKPNPVRLP